MKKELLRVSTQLKTAVERSEQSEAIINLMSSEGLHTTDVDGNVRVDRIGFAVEVKLKDIRKQLKFVEKQISGGVNEKSLRTIVAELSKKFDQMEDRE